MVLNLCLVACMNYLSGPHAESVCMCRTMRKFGATEFNYAYTEKIKYKIGLVNAKTTRFLLFELGDAS